MFECPSNTIEKSFFGDVVICYEHDLTFDSDLPTQIELIYHGILNFC